MMLVVGRMTATARATLVLDAKALAKSWETNAAAAPAAAMPSTAPSIDSTSLPVNGSAFS